MAATGKKVSYQPSVITYLDIMGFRGLVTERSAGEISHTLRILKERVQPGRDLVHEFHIQHFSDLAVRVLPVIPGPGRGGDVWFEVLNVVYLQVSLIDEGILVRGGITFGDIVKSWGLLYGPGLIRAYELEREASVPRVLVDTRLLTKDLRTNSLLRNPDHDYKTEMKYIRRLIRRDTDGKYFVDYLRAIASEFDPPETYLQFLEFHRKHIVQGLAKFKGDKEVLRKYKWLRAYHNATVARGLRAKTAQKKYLV
jgi:hypothetical protein